MARARCLTIASDETALLDAWIRYHAYQFGFECLTIHDDAVASAGTVALLRRAERAGAEIRRGAMPTSDVDRLAEVWDGGVSHEFVLPLACDEFLAVQTNQGVSCRRDRIHAALDECGHERRALSYAPGLVRDAPTDGFAIAPIRRAFLPAGVPPQASAPSRGTALTLIDLGIMEGDQPAREDHGVRVVFQGLGNLLDALGIRDPRFGAPVATPRAGPDDTVWIRTTPAARPVRFKADAYRRAHQDVAASNWPPFVHYSSFGAREGRSPG